MLKRYFPILGWLPAYPKSYLSGDLAAGFTVGIMLIPQGMAYALIAGLPPVYGLYAALVPNIIYAITGSSRKLAVGPVGLDSLIVASSLGAMKLASAEAYIAMAIFLAFMVGALQLIMGFFKMGFLANFLSRPVVSGFTSAAALVIIVSQLKHFLGVKVNSNSTIDTLFELIQRLGNTNFYDLAIGIATIFVILGIKKFNKKLPASMVVVVLSIIGIYLFMVNETDVNILGAIPDGLPSFTLPSVAIEEWLSVVTVALALAFIAFAEAMTIAKSVEDKSKEYYTDPNQELRALGLSNMIGSLFQSYPVNAGLSRTAVNVDEGAQTGMAAIISAIVVGLTLLFLTPFFYYLPKSVLGGIIMVAIYRLIDLKYPQELFKKKKDEFVLLLMTFLTTLFVGVSEGIIFGVLFSLVFLVYRISKPHIAILGKITGMEYFKNVTRFEDDVEVHPKILMIRFDAQLFFANVDYFKTELLKAIDEKGDQLAYIILNAEPVNYLDDTATKQLHQLIVELRKDGLTFKLAGAIGPIRDILNISGLTEVIGKENIYVRTAEAYADCLEKVERTPIQEKVSLQHR